MGKIFCIIIITFLSLGCSRAPSTIEETVYITFLKPDFTGKNAELNDLTPPIYFSKDFWNYFIRKFPQSTSEIFYSHLINRQELIKLKDTTLKIGMIDYGIRSLLIHELPSTAQGNEIKNEFRPTVFFEQNDSERSVKVKDSVFIPTLTEGISKEYSRFLQILKDKRNPPIFIYKTDFLSHIENVYN